MRMTKLKLFIAASLLSVVLGVTGCSTVERYEQPSDERAEPASSQIEKDGLILRKEEGSDDMERLD